MKNKKLVRWLCLLLMVVAVVGVTVVSAAPKATPEGLVLEDMPIILPANATDVEKTAAKELQHYLREITGSASSMITENVPVDSAIYLGATKFARDNHVTYTDKNGEGEGWAIKAVGSSLVITGGEQRGTLYGVYHLLEDVLGVHWWNLWEEYVPEMEDAVLPYDFSLSGEPVFAERGIYFNGGPSTLYYARNRLNGWSDNIPQEYGGKNEFTRPYHVHTFNRYYPPFYAAPTTATAARWTDAINPDGISWFEEHPDWYSYSKARGERISYGQMCMSNEELIADFSEKILIAIELSYEDADLEKKDRPKYVSITPNDLGGLCECDLCLASTAASGPSGHLLKFVNKIAAVVAEAYPEIKVETLAYDQYFEVPLDDTVPADNVVIRLASSDVNIQRNIDHPTNAKVKARLYAWGELLQPGQLWYWDYATNWSETGVFINHFKWFNDYRQLADVGGFGSFTECNNINNMDMWDLKHWLLAKAQENPYQDEYELTKIFLNGYYGEAAAQDIYDYLIMMDTLNDASEIAYTFSTKSIEAPWLSAENVKKGNAYFEAAVAKTEANDALSAEEKELFINRIQWARSGLDRQILANYDRYVSEMAATAGGDPEKLFGIGRQETGKRLVSAFQWVCNMELEEDYTGIQNPGKRGDQGGNAGKTYSQYLQGTDPVSGDLVPRPSIPEQILEDHPGIDEEHIYEYTAASFWNASELFGFAWVSEVGDASYEGGSSVMVDQKKHVQERGEVSPYYSFSETKSFPASFKPKWYLGDPIQNDGEWHLYRAEDVIALNADSNLFSLYDSSLRFELDDMAHLVEEFVDVYVSMKVVGDPSGTDPNNYVRIYVDRIFIVEDCTSYDLDYTSTIPATCTSNAFQVGTCIICGKEARKEVGGTKLTHQFTGDYIYNAETNTYSNTCSVCGKVEYSHLKTQLPGEVMESLIAENTELDRVYDYGLKDFTVSSSKPGYAEKIQDADSDLGEAVYWDLSKAPVLTYFRITEAQGVKLWYNNAPTPPTAKDIITDGEYHIYKMEDVDLFAGNVANLVFFDWTLQLDTKSLSHLQGKKADLYLSFKVEGELNFDDPNNLPKYYIDRIIIAENCSNHSAETYTYDAAEGVYVGNCVNCGVEIRSDRPLDLLLAIAKGEVKAAHIDDYGASAFNLSDLSFVEDADAYKQQAVYVPNGFNGGDVVFSFAYAGEVMRFKGAELKANDGKGYQYYKFEDVVIPTEPEDIGYIWSFGWRVQLRSLWSYFKQKAGDTLDLYMSVKIDGNDFYIDRFIVVDDCSNHIDPESDVKLSSATCYKGETHQATCSVCGETFETEMVETKLPHRFGEYVLNAETGMMEARCQNTGCTETNAYGSGMLPQVVQDRLNELGLGVEHAHVYGPEAMDPGENGFFDIINDAEAYNGKTLFCDSNNLASANQIHISQDVKFGFSSSNIWFSVPVAQLKANSGKGYQLYEFENLTVPAVGNATYLYSFNHHLQIGSIMNWARELEGETVDVYLSMKVQGKFNWSKPYDMYWVDRLIVIDRCDNYDIDYKAPENTTCADTNVNYVGYCPVCGKEFTRPGTAVDGHSFTRYMSPNRQEIKEFIAECDYGCGATDTKTVESQNWRDLLPEELPENVKSHVIQAYRVPEFYISGGNAALDGLYLDPDTGRAVALRTYDTNLSAGTQYALNTSNGLLCCMYKAGMPSIGLGYFNGKEIAANAGDGKYHLYGLKSVIPVVFEDYNYMYFFGDWTMQCQMIDDDLLLKGYQGKTVDIYLYMKVEGNPSCADFDKPSYWIDQIIVAESCRMDETWTVVKEATCAEKGLMTGDCKICGLKGSTVETPTLPHTIENGYISQAPTCKTNAFEYGICTVCGTIVQKQEIPGTMLQCEFTNYVKMDDDSGREVAYCDNGCGERHIRNANYKGENMEIPDILKPILPALGGAASGKNFGFSDIKTTDWYFESVKNAWENKLIDGVTATEFRPNEALTVAQAVKLAAAYHEKWFTGSVTLENSSGNWYDSYVDYAVDNGIIDSKYANYTTAQMNKAIGRSEFVSIFAKTMDDESLVGYNSVADNAIPDVKMTDENANAIYTFYRAGILTGSDGKGTFNPTSSIKRSEVAAILSRMFNEGIRQAITLN